MAVDVKILNKMLANHLAVYEKYNISWLKLELSQKWKISLTF